LEGIAICCGVTFYPFANFTITKTFFSGEMRGKLGLNSTPSGLRGIHLFRFPLIASEVIEVKPFGLLYQRLWGKTGRTEVFWNRNQSPKDFNLSNREYSHGKKQT